MARGTVKAESQTRQLSVTPVGEWTPGATTLNFRAAIVRQRRLFSVLVKHVSRDRERAFVRFPDGCTGWVPVDELMPG